MKKILAVAIVVFFFICMTHIVATEYGGVWQAYLVFPSIVVAVGLFVWACVYLSIGK